jgi:hypothetical protein
MPYRGDGPSCTACDQPAVLECRHCSRGLCRGHALVAAFFVPVGECAAPLDRSCVRTGDGDDRERSRRRQTGDWAGSASRSMQPGWNMFDRNLRR